MEYKHAIEYQLLTPNVHFGECNAGLTAASNCCIIANATLEVERIEKWNIRMGKE